MSQAGKREVRTVFDERQGTGWPPGAPARPRWRARAHNGDQVRFRGTPHTTLYQVQQLFVVAIGLAVAGGCLALLSRVGPPRRT